MSADPIGVADDVNLYTYVGNNPVNATDPLGLYSRTQFPNDARVAWDMTMNDMKEIGDKIEEVNYTITCTTKLLVNKNEHYARNKNNKIPADARETFVKQSDSRNIYHNHGTSGNIKYLSKDGHTEVVYNKQGNIVTNDENMGTYNYGNNDLEHVFEDMLPYYVRGNSENDQTKWWNRITGRDDFQ